MRQVFFLFLIGTLLAVGFAPSLILAATCNETCGSTSDCDSTCPICIGTCVSCYELGNATACLSPDTGGNANCQWDGQNCKSITDVPSMPKQIWFILLIPLALSVMYVIRLRRNSSLLNK